MHAANKEPLTPPPMLSAILESVDVEAHVAFYTDVLGFQRLPEPTVEEHGLTAVVAGHMFLGFRPVAEPPAPGGVTIYFLVPELAPLRDRIRDHGVELASDIARLPWGFDGFRVDDPMGYRLLFGQKIGPEDAEEVPDEDPEETLRRKKAEPVLDLGDPGAALEAVFSGDEEISQRAILDDLLGPLMAAGDSAAFTAAVERIRQGTVRTYADIKTALRELPPEMSGKLAEMVRDAEERLKALEEEEEEE